MLNITICDKDTKLSNHEIKDLAKAFGQEGLKYSANEAEGLDFSFVHLLLGQMNGKIDFEYKYGDLSINISVPQLA